MIGALKQGIKTGLLSALHGDPDIYYGQFKGTSDFLPLLIKNIVRPSRYFTKAKFGQTSLLPKSMWAGKACPEEFVTGTQNWTEHLKTFKEKGAVVVPGYFDQSACDALIEELQIGNALKTEADVYQYGVMPQLSPRLMHFWMDMPALGMISRYFDRMPYARYYPSVSVANPASSTEPTRTSQYPDDINLALGWHYDTVNLVQFAVLLNDVDESGSCMQVVAGTHRSHHLKFTKDDYYLSDDYIEKRGLEIINCAGPKGTVYFFDSNAYHRLKSVKGKPRAMCKCDFTPGNNIITQCGSIASTLRDYPDALDKLNPVQREILSGLYPRAPFGGFLYQNGEFRQDRSRL